MSGVAIVENVGLDFCGDKVALDSSKKNLEVFFVGGMTEVIHWLTKAVADGAIYGDHKALIVNVVIVGRVR